MAQPAGSPGHGHELVNAWKNECEGWLALGQASEGRGIYRVEQTEGLTCAWWQGDGDESMENVLMVGPACTGEKLHALLDGAAAAVQASRRPTVLRLIPAGDPQAWRAAAQTHGFTFQDAEPLMACDLNQPRPVARFAAEITVEAVVDRASHEAAFEVVHEVFGGPRGLTRFFNPFGPVQMYLARWQGEPAASATVWPFAGVAGIYSVATRPQFRGRGLASAVLEMALQDAQKRGVPLATLRTGDSLIPFYERLGFREAGRIDRYRKA